jgi:gliding motility-associated-like protein
LKSGDYKVYVRDKNNCGVVDEEVFLLMYPYYFTPNDDTYNDTWKINLSEFEKGLTIKIFDRNGKFLKELSNDVGWDGMLNGEKLPATDYWFLVTRANGKEHRGHFTLKR